LGSGPKNLGAPGSTGVQREPGGTQWPGGDIPLPRVKYPANVNTRRLVSRWGQKWQCACIYFLRSPPRPATPPVRGAGRLFRHFYGGESGLGKLAL